MNTENDFCLDLSSPLHSLAVCSGGKILEECSFPVERRTTGPVFSVWYRLQERWGMPTRILVGLGPGSYNGLRAALALAAGVRLATGVPVRGISSLLILDPLPTGRFTLLGDARGGTFYLAQVAGRQFLREPVLFSPEEAIQEAQRMEDPIFRLGPNPLLRAWPELRPRAAWLPQATAENSTTAEPDLPAPIYLKPPHITLPGNNLHK